MRSILPYGAVWLARNRKLGRLRAVKVVYREAFDHDGPFQREFNGVEKFESISRSHKGLVDILAVGGTDDTFYYVMELADNADARDSRSPKWVDQAVPRNGIPAHYSPRTLKSELRCRGSLPLTECMDIGLRLIRALGQLHRAGLVHRDIKPSNASAVGTKVRVLATIGGEPRWQMREISAGGGGWLQNDPRPNFGLGDAMVAELVRIEWPSGIVQEIRDVATNQILEVIEPPRLMITRTVTFSWPSRLEETWVLESAASAEGPWTRIDQRSQLFVGTVEDQVTITIRPDSNMEIFRLSRR